MRVRRGLLTEGFLEGDECCSFHGKSKPRESVENDAKIPGKVTPEG